MGGWVPAVVQVVTAVALVRAVDWRARRWRTLWIPLAAIFGGLTSAVAYEILQLLGLASEPAPWLLWVWVAL